MATYFRRRGKTSHSGRFGTLLRNSPGSTSMSALPETLMIVALLLLAKTESTKKAQEMRWCGKRPNPILLAKSARFATELFSSCKEHFRMLGIDPNLAKESRRLCTISRMCYAYVDDLGDNGDFNAAFTDCFKKLIDGMETTSRRLVTDYHVNLSTLVEKVQKCRPMNVPREEAYLLGMVGWFADFVSA
ncbi:uncharacterized protein LOC144173341 [Haemaphysalis longicornis]